MKRTIDISTRGTRVNVQNSRIQIEREDQTLASIPAEDMNLLVLSTTGISISSGVLKCLGDHGAALLACDESYLPCGIFLPMQSHVLASERIRLQAEASEPLKKNLWTKLVVAKIANQAQVATVPDVKRRLELLAGKVRSGDPENLEGQAARLYWSHFLSNFRAPDSTPFRRFREGPPPNGLLNFGYAVLRSMTARALCAAGLNPGLGIHHRNRYSGFCLADDLMEPYRPVVDQVVLELVADGFCEVNQDSKPMLIGAMYGEVMLGGSSFSCCTALERTASSMAKALEVQVKEKKPVAEAVKHLVVPSLVVKCH